MHFQTDKLRSTTPTPFLLTYCALDSFLIGREKPGTQSEVARLISETLEQERHQQQQRLEDPYEQSTEEVSQQGTALYIHPWPFLYWSLEQDHHADWVAVQKTHCSL